MIECPGGGNDRLLRPISLLRDSATTRAVRVASKEASRVQFDRYAAESCFFP